jgi:uncharacterized alkaline shock family protein YloU
MFGRNWRVIMPFSEEPGEIRVSVSTLVEMAARSAFLVEGVMGDFNHLLRNTKVVVQGETLSPNDRVSTKEKGVFINISLKVDSRKNWEEIAQEVQKRVANMIREWGFPLEGVNVEVSEVEWFLE